MLPKIISGIIGLDVVGLLIYQFKEINSADLKSRLWSEHARTNKTNLG
jgi:hypothetical protein